MTEFREAVAYAIYCVGLEEPEEALIYVPLRWSYCRVVFARSSWKAPCVDCYSLYGTKHRHPKPTTIIEVDESLFWLQTSVQAFSTNAIES